MASATDASGAIFDSNEAPVSPTAWKLILRAAMIGARKLDPTTVCRSSQEVSLSSF